MVWYKAEQIDEQWKLEWGRDEDIYGVYFDCSERERNKWGEIEQI